MHHSLSGVSETVTPLLPISNALVHLTLRARDALLRASDPHVYLELGDPGPGDQVIKIKIIFGPSLSPKPGL